MELMANAGVDLYAAGVLHHSWELGLQDERGVSIARRLEAPVMFASFAGRAGGDYRYGVGHSTIWEPRRCRAH